MNSHLKEIIYHIIQIRSDKVKMKISQVGYCKIDIMNCRVNQHSDWTWLFSCYSCLWEWEISGTQGYLLSLKSNLRCCYCSISAIAFRLNFYKSLTFLEEERNVFFSRFRAITISVTEKTSKSFCSRMQDYFKKQKTPKGILITFLCYFFLWGWTITNT